MSGEAAGDADRGLVYPFVVVQSNGGHFDDAAYVAGAEFGAIEARLRTETDGFSEYVRTDNVRQIDLAAMHNGWTVNAEPWSEHPDEWTLMAFEKAEVAP